MLTGVDDDDSSPAALASVLRTTAAGTSPMVSAAAASSSSHVVFVLPSTRSARAAADDAAAAAATPAHAAAASSASSVGAGGDASVATSSHPARCSCSPAFKRQTYLSYLTLGVIYGDIGTSPLYTFSSVFLKPPSNENEVLGALSLMIYSILFVFLVKYVVFMLLVDDHGEGGTFALYSLLTRDLRTKYATSSSNTATIARAQSCFSVLAMLGVAAIVADGVLTPAISVLGAMSGLKVAAPPGSLTDQSIAGITCAILFVFFVFQSWGTHRVGRLFSPILLLWFLALAAIGIYNITLAPRALLAFNPKYAADFLGQGSEPGGWASLGAVFLTLTGSEALFADLGNFNAKAIRTSAVFLVIPSLILCYLGQGAAILVNPTIVSNTFYLSTPSPVFYPMLVLATLAAIIASQALVTATFSIVSQAMHLDHFPRMTIQRRNAKQFGEVYIPEVNWFLMVLVLVVVGGFQTATVLGYAYGVTVSSAFLITTILYSACVVIHFDRHWLWAVAFFLLFGFVDGNFLAANLLKVPLGGWFSLTIMAVLFAVLALWKWGRARMLAKQDEMRVPFADLASSTTTPLGLIPTLQMDSEMLVCMSGKPGSAPVSMVHFFHRVQARPKFIVLLTVSALDVAFVDPASAMPGGGGKYQVEPVAGGGASGLDRVFHVGVYHGYAECPPRMEQIAACIIRELCMPPELVAFPPEPDNAVVTRVDPTYLVGRDFVQSKHEEGDSKHVLQRLGVWAFQFLLALARSPLSGLHIPAEATLEVGVMVKI